MLFKSVFLALIICLYLGGYYAFLELAAYGLLSGGIIAGVAIFMKIKCRSDGNCCTKDEIPADFEVLEKSLKENLFGQPIAKNIVVTALRRHWQHGSKPSKPLVMSFHGGPGIGKNYVTKFIQEALYSAGSKSPHVHMFNGRRDFPETDRVEFYKEDLSNRIRRSVNNCPKQLFIFDEADHLPPELLDAISPFFLELPYINGVSYRECIFILLSNTGAVEINNLAYDLWKTGIEQNQITLHTFDGLKANGAFDILIEYHHSTNLIDHYIPFLPLKLEHVTSCIVHEFKKRGRIPTEREIWEVVESLSWEPDMHEGFSRTGCKRLGQKVALVL